MEAAANLVAVLAWPALVYVLLAHIFRDNIARAIDRIRNVGYGQARIDMGGQKPVPPTDPNPSPKQNGETGAPLSPEEQQALDQIKKDLPKESDQIKFLLRFNRRLVIDKQHELRYRNIFGSQIRALRFLNTGPKPMDMIQRYYDEMTPLYQPWYTFQAWLNFLIQSQLILITGNQVTITDIGRDFLRYIVNEGLSEDKML